MFRSEVAITDDDVPVVGATTGNLGSPPQPLSGARTIGGAVSDQGGGLASVVLLVDGRQFAQAPATCSEPYSTPTPCPPQVVASFDVDSATAGAGSPHRGAAGRRCGRQLGRRPRRLLHRRRSAAAAAAATAARRGSGRADRRTAERREHARLDRRPRSARDGNASSSPAARPSRAAKVIVRSRPFGVRRAARAASSDG